MLGRTWRIMTPSYRLASANDTNPDVADGDTCAKQRQVPQLGGVQPRSGRGDGLNRRNHFGSHPERDEPDVRGFLYAIVRIKPELLEDLLIPENGRSPRRVHPQRPLLRLDKLP